VVFAFFHLLLLLGILGWAIVSLVQGNMSRGLLIAVCLAFYYILALHPQVKKEIDRIRQKKQNKEHP
jgi:hypothetical protein